MTIDVQRVNGRVFRRYRVRATPPHAPEPWECDRPLSRRKAEAKLYELGNHSADIAEAFAVADDAFNGALSGYEAPYFVRAVRDVLDAPLREHGFSYADSRPSGTAYWRSGPRFLRVGYLAESMPDYELLIGVGVLRGGLLRPKSEHSIGVWRLLPPNEGPRIANWTFDSEEKLRAQLQRAWAEALLPYALPLLEDEDELLRVISAFDTNDDLYEAVRQLQARLRKAGEDDAADGLAGALAASSMPGEIFGNLRYELSQLREHGVAQRIGAREEVEALIAALDDALKPRL